MSPLSTAPTSIPIVDCAQCGRPHPETRKHCSTCGSPSVFAGSRWCLLSILAAAFNASRECRAEYDDTLYAQYES